MLTTKSLEEAAVRAYYPTTEEVEGIWFLLEKGRTTVMLTAEITMELGRAHYTIDRSHQTDRTSDKSRDLSRSISIPKDSRVSSGWFKGKKQS